MCLLSRSSHSSFATLFGPDWLSDGVLLWYANTCSQRTICITSYCRTQNDQQKNRGTSFLFVSNEIYNYFECWKLHNLCFWFICLPLPWPLHVYCCRVFALDFPRDQMSVRWIFYWLSLVFRGGILLFFPAQPQRHLWFLLTAHVLCCLF